MIKLITDILKSIYNKLFNNSQSNMPDFPLTNVIIYDNAISNLNNKLYDDWKYKQTLEITGNSNYKITPVFIKTEIENNHEFKALNMIDATIKCIDDLKLYGYFKKNYKKIYILIDKSTILMEINFINNYKTNDILIVRPKIE